MTESKATAAGNNVTHLGESTVAYADGEGGPGDRVVSFRAADVVVSAGYPPGRYDDYEVVIGVILGAPPPGDALVWVLGGVHGVAALLQPVAQRLTVGTSSLTWSYVGGFNSCWTEYTVSATSEDAYARVAQLPEM